MEIEIIFEPGITDIHPEEILADVIGHFLRYPEQTKELSEQLQRNGFLEISRGDAHVYITDTDNNNTTTSNLENNN
ncbi:hypothetical protein [Solirubrum puertoriconensis]|uniref:Uncharacterized protein n=1 Tax=Solirubrum puertoriconensis TaxID=1751427 RepID=A0A9X0HK68_SOLP1|nr:hypothetical protein [Solirubrum puertoriconensis]KUG07440.1 hypothetical protein ASU33_13890 [Solirubrum puertoriconensis]